MKKFSTSMPQNTSIQSRTVQAHSTSPRNTSGRSKSGRSKSGRSKSSLSQSIAPLSLSLSLSLAIMTTALGTTLAPNNALASSVASETDSSDQTHTYDYLFNNFIYAYDENKNPKIDIQTNYRFAGNVGDATQYSSFNTFSTGNASTNNNTLYVDSGAGIYDDSALTSSGAYTISGAAGHIALNGDITTVTATGNATIMDATYSETNSTGYIANLTGAYININTINFTPDDTYIKTTVDTVTASGNSVILIDGTVGVGWAGENGESPETLQDNVGSYLTGAYVESSNINSSAQFNLYNNSVLIEGGLVLENIGRSLENGAVAGAFVSAVTGDAYMSGNSVTITGGNVQADQIMGAGFYSTEFTMAKILGTLDDNYAKNLYNIGGFTNNNSSATLFNNSVTIEDAEDDFLACKIMGAYSGATNTSTLYNNSVTISGGNFVSNIDANGDMNPLNIMGAFINPEIWQKVDPEYTQWGEYLTPDDTIVTMEAYGNSVTITDGTIEGTVAGAAIKVDAVTAASLSKLEGTLTYNGTLSNNTVTIYGGTIANRNSIYGGEAYNGIYGAIYQGVDQSNEDKSVTNNYSITDNTVNIGFSAMLGDEINIGGGAYNNSGDADFIYFTLTPNANTYDGNTLNINQLASTQTISTIANFEYINIVLGAENTATQLSNTALIDLSGTLYLGNGYSDNSDVTEDYDTVATKYANFGLYVSSDNTLVVGDTVTLFTASNIDGYFTNLGEDNSGTYTGTYGTFLTNTWDILTSGDATDGYTMTATLKSTQAGEQSKVLGEASVSTMSALSAGADLLTGPAMASAQAKVRAQTNSQASSQGASKESGKQSGASAQSASSGTSAASFAVSSVGQSRYHTGSHVDTESFSVNAGVAYGGQGTDGDWLTGAFLEYNRGDYTTYNSFSTGTVEGEGTSNAFGLGGFARYDFNRNSSKYKDFNPYVEGSVRLGYVESDYASDGGDGAGIPMAFEVQHMYMGAHLGLGSVSQLTDRLSLDLSLRYFWTHQMAGNENIAGHNVDFHAVDSHRVRLGARTDYAVMDDQESGRFTLYGGVAMEQEFDGIAKSTVDGYDAPAPSLQGTTVIGELGFTYSPVDFLPISIDLGLQGYTGKREGVSGSLQLIYSF